MGIRESLLNTITSVADSDFVRIVTSAGASSKATLQNVIKSFETGLGAKSSLTTSDYIRVVGSDNEAYKQSVSSVMQMMGIEDVVNGTRGQIGSLPNGNIDDFATDKIYGTYYLNNSDSDITGTKPDTSGQGLLFCKQQSSAIYRQIYIGVASSSAMKVRYYYNNAWTQWSNLPIRSEIDTLNSKTAINTAAVSGGALPLYASMVGQVIYLRALYISPSSAISAGTMTTVGILPEGYRPSATAYIGGTFATNSGHAIGLRGQVDTTGAIKMMFEEAVPTSTSLSGTIIFIA